MVAPLVPADLQAELRAWAPGGRAVPVESTIGGYSNLTFVARIGDDDCVVKAAATPAKRADLRREADMLRRLADAEVPFACPEALVLLDGNWTVLVMRRVEGTSALTGRVTPAGLRVRAGLVGELLASVHATVLSPLGDPSADLDLGRRAHAVAAALTAAELPPVIAEPLAAALGDPLLQRGISPVHGDFGLHNVLWRTVGRRPPAVALLFDWEWSGWGNPLIDTAWLWWTFQHRRIAPDAWNAFVDGYGRAALQAMGWSASTVNTMIRAQMAQILVRTTPDSSGREEWLKRLRELDRLAPPRL